MAPASQGATVKPEQRQRFEADLRRLAANMKHEQIENEGAILVSADEIAEKVLAALDTAMAVPDPTGDAEAEVAQLRNGLAVASGLASGHANHRRAAIPRAHRVRG